MDEISNISEIYNNKVSVLEERISNLEETIGVDYNEDNSEEQISLSESIKCPYCGKEFLVEYNENNTEVICPKCNNLIELDWGEYEDDM